MIAIADDEEGLRGKRSSKPFQERLIFPRRHSLAPNVLLHVGSIAKVAPIGRQLRAQPLVPRKMIGHCIHIEKQWPLAAFSLDQIDRPVIVETISFEAARSQVLNIQIMCDTGGRLKCARPEKGAVERIEAEGLVAAALQYARQPAIDVTGSDPCYRRCKPPERADRQTREHVVFGEPAWSADALDEKLARPAIERLKMSMIPSRHLDPGRHCDVKARFIVQQDDVRRLARWIANDTANFTRVSARALRCLEISVGNQFVNRLHSRPGKFGNMALALEILDENGR